jgi:membrane associated rhomboid family serine protease
LSVGASTSVFGILGSQLAFIIVNWKALDYPGSGRDKYLLVTVIIIVLNFLFGISNAHVDILGHLGGLIVGIMIGLALIDAGPVDRRNQQYERLVKRIGYGCLVAYFGVGFLLFFTVRDPKP